MRQAQAIATLGEFNREVNRLIQQFREAKTEAEQTDLCQNIRESTFLDIIIQALNDKVTFRRDCDFNQLIDLMCFLVANREIRYLMHEYGCDSVILSELIKRLKAEDVASIHSCLTILAVFLSDEPHRYLLVEIMIKRKYNKDICVYFCKHAYGENSSAILQIILFLVEKKNLFKMIMSLPMSSRALVSVYLKIIALFDSNSLSLPDRLLSLEIISKLSIHEIARFRKHFSLETLISLFKQSVDLFHDSDEQEQVLDLMSKFVANLLRCPKQQEHPLFLYVNDKGERLVNDEERRLVIDFLLFASQQPYDSKIKYIARRIIGAFNGIASNTLFYPLFDELPLFPRFSDVLMTENLKSWRIGFKGLFDLIYNRYQGLVFSSAAYQSLSVLLNSTDELISEDANAVFVYLTSEFSQYHPYNRAEQQQIEEQQPQQKGQDEEVETDDHYAFQLDLLFDEDPMVVEMVLSTLCDQLQDPTQRVLIQNRKDMVHIMLPLLKSSDLSIRIHLASFFMHYFHYNFDGIDKAVANGFFKHFMDRLPSDSINESAKILQLILVVLQEARRSSEGNAINHESEDNLLINYEGLSEPFVPNVAHDRMSRVTNEFFRLGIIPRVTGILNARNPVLCDLCIDIFAKLSFVQPFYEQLIAIDVVKLRELVASFFNLLSLDNKKLLSSALPIMWSLTYVKECAVALCHRENILSLIRRVRNTPMASKYAEYLHRRFAFLLMGLSAYRDNHPFLLETGLFDFIVDEFAYIANGNFSERQIYLIRARMLTVVHNLLDTEIFREKFQQFPLLMPLRSVLLSGFGSVEIVVVRALQLFCCIAPDNHQVLRRSGFFSALLFSLFVRSSGHDSQLRFHIYNVMNTLCDRSPDHVNRFRQLNSQRYLRNYLREEPQDANLFRLVENHPELLRPDRPRLMRQSLFAHRRIYPDIHKVDRAPPNLRRPANPANSYSWRGRKSAP